MAGAAHGHFLPREGRALGGVELRMGPDGLRVRRCRIGHGVLAHWKVGEMHGPGRSLRAKKNNAGVRQAETVGGPTDGSCN